MFYSNFALKNQQSRSWILYEQCHFCTIIKLFFTVIQKQMGHSVRTIHLFYPNFYLLQIPTAKYTPNWIRTPSGFYPSLRKNRKPSPTLVTPLQFLRSTWNTKKRWSWNAKDRGTVSLLQSVDRESWNASRNSRSEWNIWKARTAIWDRWSTSWKSKLDCWRLRLWVTAKLVVF